MKLSVKKRWGYVHVRGGRVLVVAHDHQISSATYDGTVDDVVTVPVSSSQLGARPHQKRSFDAKWVTAKIGDLAVEIIAQKTANLLGYGYFSGDAINVIRYVNDAEKERIAAWFVSGRGLRFSIPLEMELEPFIASVMGIKYSGADLACARLEVSDERHMEAALNGLLAAYAYEADDMTPTTHMLVTSAVRKAKKTGTVHCQPPKHAQPYAAQPFLHELLLSSSELAPHDFHPPDMPNAGHPCSSADTRVPL